MKTRTVLQRNGKAIRSLTRLVNAWLVTFWFLFATGVAVAQSSLPKTATYQAIQERWFGVSRDELRKAAEAEVADAQLYFGFTEIKAAEEANSQAFRWTTRALSNGPDISEAEQAAFETKWQAVSEPEHRRAAENGDRGAQVALAKRESDLAFVRARQGFAWIKKAAAQSLINAEEEVAKRYLGLSSWLVIPTDEKEGIKWLESAANHDSEWARHKQSDFLLSGRYGKPDLLQGLGNLRHCSDRDCPRARYELAMYYANGDGEPRSPEETPVELLRRSARVGYNKAIAVLADRYRTGLGVAKDWVLASELYQAALEADARVDYNYRSHAEQVLKLVDDQYAPKFHPSPHNARFARVLSHYFKAAVRHDADAMHALGTMYLLGADVPRNTLEAFNWFSLAAGRGHATAGADRDKLKSSFTTEELERASRWLEQRQSRWFHNR